jgi:archaellum component FlaF (FlaF/FlaG flagellin family)
MNLSNLPFFILFFAIVYLSIVYGLLKIAEAQRNNVTKIYPKISRNVVDSKQQMKTP